ncbi:hypothetical protein [Cellvibrio sp. UBA7661]|uniref:hypothetical protein n=1 Tax=Cellvibrio sp. UBA7661 TaxID=1946311 RepID=UPI002F35D495
MRLINLLSLCLLFIAALSGCSDNQVKKDMEFSKASPDSLLVFGLLLNTPFPNPEFTFRKYDPLTGTPSLKETFKAQPLGSNWLASGGIGQYNVQSYFVLNMPAGHWFLECIRVGKVDSVSSYNHILCPSNDTLAFKLIPGETSYIGEYYFYAETMGIIQFDLIGSDVERANQKIGEYKNITSSLTVQVPNSAKYNCVKKRVGLIGYECDMKVASVKESGLKTVRQPRDFDKKH